MEKCCKNCKYRLGDRGRELEVINGKYGIKIYSNCAKFNERAEFTFDPDTRVGVGIAFNEDECCPRFELSGKTEQVPVVEAVDFSEPRPSRWTKEEKEPPPPPPEQPPIPEQVEDYEDDDIPF